MVHVAKHDGKFVVHSNDDTLTPEDLALGYKQLLGYLENQCSLEDAVERIKILTRRFAKQQRTWLRRFQYFWEGHWVDASEKTTETLVNEALAYIDSRPPPPLLGGPIWGLTDLRV